MFSIGWTPWGPLLGPTNPGTTIVALETLDIRRRGFSPLYDITYSNILTSDRSTGPYGSGFMAERNTPLPPSASAANPKSQAPNHKQYPMTKIQMSKTRKFWILKIGIWNLFGIWNLVLGISSACTGSTSSAPSLAPIYCRRRIA